MTKSAFSAVVDAFKDALSVAPAVSTRVLRGRRRPIPESWTDAVNVYFDSAQPEPRAIFGAPVDWTAMVCVDGYAKTTDANLSGDEAVDMLLKSVYERLAADPTLGGKVIDIGDPIVEIEADDSAERTGWMRLKYPVQLRTANSLLELQ